MTIINPDHLLDQAERLITPPGGGAPRQADLRRAISNAYYAVFHAVLTEAADTMVGKTLRHTPRYELAYRSIDHSSLRSFCEKVKMYEGLKLEKQPDKYRKYAPANGFGPDILAVANAVVELYEKRHRADYDPLFRAKRSDATVAVSTARSALGRFRSASRIRQKTFVSLVVFSPR